MTKRKKPASIPPPPPPPPVDDEIHRLKQALAEQQAENRALRTTLEMQPKEYQAEYSIAGALIRMLEERNDYKTRVHKAELMAQRLVQLEADFNQAIGSESPLRGADIVLWARGMLEENKRLRERKE